jgi:DNA modification methylase
MTDYTPDDMLLRADARSVPLADNSVQVCVTSPPYWGLRDYKLGDAGIGLERTPEEYVANIVQVFREVWRVLRDDGTLWCNLGDCIHDKQLQGIPWRVAFALQADGWYLRSDIIWAKPNPMPESVTDRPTKAHEYLFLLTKRARYYYDAEAVAEASIRAGKFPGGDYAGREVPEGVNHGWLNKTGVPPTRNRRDVWTIPTQPYRGAHFATYPEKLVEPCVLAGSRAGDTVLDPFCGSGTTGAVARRLGREFVGLDMSAEYLELARKRIGAVPMGMGL